MSFSSAAPTRNEWTSEDKDFQLVYVTDLGQPEFFYLDTCYWTLLRLTRPELEILARALEAYRCMVGELAIRTVGGEQITVCRTPAGMSVAIDGRPKLLEFFRVMDLLEVLTAALRDTAR